MRPVSRRILLLVAAESALIVAAVWLAAYVRFGSWMWDVMAGERVHGDDTPVPVLAKGETTTGRLWTYVRDDRPFAGPAPPAAVFFYSPDRAGVHPNEHLAGYAGVLQADAYAGFNDLYAPARKPGPITEAGCWAHGRRKLYDLARLAHAPLAAEAVRRRLQASGLAGLVRQLPGQPALAVNEAVAGPPIIP